MSYREEWKETTVGEVSLIKNGKTRPKKEGSIPVYGGNGILNHSNKYNVEGETIIIGRVGAYCGATYFENRKIWVSDNALYAKAIQNNNSKYLYFLFKALDLNRFATGSSHPLLTQSRIKNLKINLPPLLIQKRIASILSAFDEKIKLNRAMNATLEAMAQAIFREMCLPDDEEELKDGWEWSTIENIGRNRKEPIKPQELDENDNYIGLEHIPRKQIAIDNWKDASEVKSNKYSFSKNDILFGKLRPYFHKVGIVPINGVCSTDILVIQPKKKEYFGFLLMHCFSEELVTEANASSSGTRMPRTNWKALARYEIALPPIEIIKVFNNQILGIVAKMNANTLENQTLSKTRDLLLPKLMSGEIEV